MQRARHQTKRRINDFDIIIGRRIRIQRTLRNLTQTQIADAIDITFQQLQKYEHGTNRISAGKLLQIARFLNVPIAAFFDGIEAAEDTAHCESPEQRQLRSLVISVEGERLYRAFSRIGNKATKLSLIRMVESLAEASE